MNQKSPSNQNMTDLWEQMGSSTGSLLGRMIGTTAEMGLQTFRSLVNNPLQEATKSNPPPNSMSSVPSDIREQTWSNMGTQYGETIGSTIGMSMDYMINTMKNMSQGMNMSMNMNAQSQGMKRIQIEMPHSNNNKKASKKSGVKKEASIPEDNSAQL